MNADEERFVHRIEAFSDIVIGFTLAQIGASLVLKPHPLELLTDPLWLFNFIWSFAVVCLMWWSHNRIFRTAFAPTAKSVVTNFALLASIVVLVFFAEAMQHVSTIADFVVAQRLYDGDLAVACAFISLLTRQGEHYFGAGLDEERSTVARRTIYINGTAAVVLVVVVLVSLLFPSNNGWTPMLLGPAIPLAFYLGRVIAVRTEKPEPA